MKTHAVIILLLTLLCAIAVRSTVDVESKLADLDAKVLQFEAKTVQLEDKNTKLDSKNVQLEATIGKLAAKIEQLEKERNADKEIRMEKDGTSALRLNNHNGTGAMQKIPFDFIKSPHTRVPGTVPAAFTACLTTPTLDHVGVHQTIQFDKVVTNFGNAYNQYTGVFTAPANGVYGFHVTLMTEGNNIAYFQIVIDGQAVDDMYVDASHTNELKSTAEFWLLQLNAGSQVWIRTSWDGYRIHGLCHTMFSGYFVFET